MQTKPATYLLSLCLALVPAMLAAQPTEQEHAARMGQANADMNALSSDLAKALEHPGFRGLLRAQIAQARTREKILKLDDVLAKAGRAPNTPPGLKKLQESSRRTDGHFKASGKRPLEGLDLYFPVPEHRENWQGGIDFLVAFAPVHAPDAEFSEFIAYSVKTGERVSLDPKQPPRIPVLVIAPEEHESHEINPNPARVVDLPKRQPDENTADAPERPVPQEDGNSYVGIKYLTIYETKEWWWEGYPEIYLLFGQAKGGDCKEEKLFLREVNRTGDMYNLWSRSYPAKWYFDDSYRNRLYIMPVERDAGGYTRLYVNTLYALRTGEITCEWTTLSTDDFFPYYRTYRDNFGFNRDYFQADGLFSQYWVYWRKEH